MKTGRQAALLIVLSILAFSGIVSAKFSQKLKMEGFYSKNARLLNNCNDGLDKVLWQRFTWDPRFTHNLLNETTGWDTLTFQTTIRCKGTFGAPESAYKTAASPIKDDVAVLGYHSHPLTIHIPIVRELWLEMTVNDIIGGTFRHQHTFTMGLFPFSLGRGIALGDAYAVTPDITGFDPPSSVDQYAPGFKLSGSIADGGLCDYDLYAGILSNRSDRFENVNDMILGSLYGHRQDQARGFGKINYIFASRLKCQLIDESDRKLYLEPYALLDDEREQFLEFRGDAHSQLGTLGFMVEAVLGDFDFGFETALNVGKQHVYGIDRNIMRKELRQIKSGDTVLGTAQTIVNSKVSAVADNPATGDTAGKKALFDESNQTIINSQMVNTTENSCLLGYNGAVIKDPATGLPSNLKNANDRFRNPYDNTLCGSMFVFDATYHVRNPDLKISGCVGLATGDDAPNADLDFMGDAAVDGAYEGFMSLQELYYGTRVRSAFLLGGKGSVPRLLSFPVGVVGGGYPQYVSRFTNLIFTGGGIAWEHETPRHTWKFNPNIITFWQQHPLRLLDPNNRPYSARSHLGTEINIYIDAMIVEGLTFSMLTGMFIAGNYYTDIKENGRPTNKEFAALLERRNKTGYSDVCLPTVGDDNAFFISAGFEYKF